MKGPNLAWEGWRNFQAMDYEESRQRQNYPQKSQTHDSFLKHGLGFYAP